MSSLASTLPGALASSRPPAPFPPGRAPGGVGPGLWIVAAVAQAHGGDATARPTLGGGATFVVTIPVSS